MDTETLQNLRSEYSAATLSEKDVAKNPIKQFDNWFKQVIAVDTHEANAMTLATASTDGRPSARIVLLKGFDERGFVFYTNYLSRRGANWLKTHWLRYCFFGLH
jgi:pyridoxamine 5'-phosphate oxidase